MNMDVGSGMPPVAEAYPADDTEALYQASLQHFQNGDWPAAIDGFERVLQSVPDHTEARAFLEEARLKASLDQVKPKPKRAAVPGILKRLFVLVGILIVVVALIMGVRYAYGRWVEPRKAQQQADLQEAQRLQNAQRLLAERDYPAAEGAFRAILSEDPGNTDAQQGLAEAQKRNALTASYTQAQQAIERQDWEEALRILATILEQDPSYKDAKTQQAFVQHQQQLSGYFGEAEKSFTAGDWAKAISGYEALRAIDLEYQSQAVTEHLFESYLKQGMALVDSVQEGDDAIREAQKLYTKALALKPQQAQVVQEMTLADKYLEAQTKAAQGDVEGARVALEWVTQQKPDYAKGRAASLLKTVTGIGAPEVTPVATPITSTAEISGTLTPTPATPSAEGSFQERYTRHMEQGDAALTAQDYVLAESEYNEAITVAVHGGVNSARLLFAAYAKLGTALARRGDQVQGLEQIKTAISIMTKSAIAMPAETYNKYVSEGDRYAGLNDYVNALAQYSKALQAVGAKCDCGLENWSVLP